MLIQDNAPGDLYTASLNADFRAGLAWLHPGRRVPRGTVRRATQLRCAGCAVQRPVWQPVRPEPTGHDPLCGPGERPARLHPPPVGARGGLRATTADHRGYRFRRVQLAGPAQAGRPGTPRCGSSTRHWPTRPSRPARPGDAGPTGSLWPGVYAAFAERFPASDLGDGWAIMSHDALVAADQAVIKISASQGQVTARNVRGTRRCRPATPCPGRPATSGSTRSPDPTGRDFPVLELTPGGALRLRDVYPLPAPAAGQ